MTWFSVLPIATALLAEVPHPVPGEPTIEPAAPEPAAVSMPAAPPEPPSHWYGAPALAVDGAVAVGVAVVAHMTETEAQRPAPAVLYYGLAAAFLTGGPVVHLVHGHRLRAAESFLLRAGALAAGAALTFAIADRVGSGCGDVSWDAICPAGYGLLLSPVTAMVLDDLLLAREPAAQAPKALSTRVLVQPGLAMFGVGGTF